MSLTYKTEVQVKKHFTAEELSMRRQEMARRRRNLSEKRNEEVKVSRIANLQRRSKSDQ
jgi:Ino eighty subunit 2